MKKISSSRKRIVRMLALVLVFVLVLAISSVAFASGGKATADTNTLFKTVAKLIGDIFKQLVAISTIVAALGITIAFFIRLLSRNQRAVEEANAWIKRIIISWLVINSLAFFISYGESIAQTLAGNNDMQQYIDQVGNIQ